MDVSGRHRIEDRYLVVSAAVAARITSTQVAGVEGTGFARSDGEPTLAEGRLGREFKYVESIAERETVAIAHHAAYASRTLLL